MQTIEEYKAYTQQLEGEVGKWHHAYDALVIERNALVRKILETEKSVEVKDHAKQELAQVCAVAIRMMHRLDVNG